MATFLLLAGPVLAQPLETVPGSPDPLLRVTPVEPERIRPKATPGLALPSIPGTRTFVLRYRPLPSEDISKIPEPVMLHVPDEYARIRANKPVEVWALLFRLLYPSLKPATPAEDRCGQNWCGDEMSVTVQLVPKPPPHMHMGSVRSEFEAGFLARDHIVTYKAAPVPPGYEEAFTATQTIKPGRPHGLYLVYRNEHGDRQIGQCLLDASDPDCQFSLFNPKTHLQIYYNFSMTLLPERKVIEESLRKLLSAWQEK